MVSTHQFMVSRPKKFTAVLVLAAAVVGVGSTAAQADGSMIDAQLLCAASTAQSLPVPPGLVDGVNVNTCDVVGRTVIAHGVGATIPEPGITVTALGEIADGEAAYLQVAVTQAGQVEVSTTEPEMKYGKILPDGTFEELSPQETIAPSVAAYDRCTDYSYALLSGNWRPGILYVNSNERLPGNISKAAFESTAVTSLNTWKNGINECGLSRALNVPGSISYGNWTYDANIAGDNTCGTADGRNVIDFGSLSGNTLGLACTWSSAGVPNQADVRLDTSDTSWVQSPIGCTGSKYDLRSVLVHELGHVLGLGHATENGWNDLTMSPNISPCNIAAQRLGAGDLAGIYVKHRG